MSSKQQWKIITVLIRVLLFTLADIILGKRFISEGFGTASLASADQPITCFIILEQLVRLTFRKADDGQVGTDNKVHGFSDLSLVTGRQHIGYGCSTREVTQFLTALQ